MTESEGVNETVAGSQESKAGANDQDKNWKAAHETMAQQKRENEELRGQMNLLLQRQQELNAAVHQRQQESRRPADPFEGLDPQDVPTVSDFQRVLAHEKAQFASELESLKKQQRLSAYRSTLEDYDNVIQAALKETEHDPELAEAMATSSNPHLLAYRLGKSGYEAQKRKQAEAQRLLDNANKPGSVTQANSGGSAMSAMDHVWNMSDEEFNARIAKIKRGGG